MGRIFNHVSVSNPVHPAIQIDVDALVDTGALALFLPKAPRGGAGESLVESIILEKCGAAVDMVGHRLLRVDSFDLKGMID